MNKFIIKIFASICAFFMLNSAAFAAIRVVSSGVKNTWRGSDTALTTNIKSEVTVRNNSTWNIDYIEVVAATEIYEHGAKLCHMLIQHNWGKWTVWVAPASCKTFCTSGYYGDTCNTQTAGTCETKNLKEALYNTPGGHYKELDIDGFYNATTYGEILIARSVDTHGIVVAPVRLSSCDDCAANKISFIKSTDNANFKQTLCAQGYKKNSNGTCERDEDKCRCAEGQGFENDNSDNCITCTEGLRSGVNENGVCRSCDIGQMFVKTGTNNCPTAKEISKEKMSACYTEKDPDKFKTCVKQ